MTSHILYKIKNNKGLMVKLYYNQSIDLNEYKTFSPFISDATRFTADEKKENSSKVLDSEINWMWEVVKG